MGKKFSKRIKRTIKKFLNPQEMRDVIEKEFGDNKGNKTKIRFDFSPHPISEPTFKLEYEYGKDAE